MKKQSSLPLPKTILWDMDGTLIDQTAAIIRTYREVIQSINGTEPDHKTIRRSLGGPMASTMALFIKEAELEEAAASFRESFPKVMFDGLIVFPGALELIRSAHEAAISQTILTNKHGETARKISERIGFSKYIPICVGSKDTQWNKPDSELTNYALAQTNAINENTCIIGDSPTDIETARNAKIPCYCVTTGAHNTEELLNSGADAVFDNLLDLKRALGL